MEKDLIHEIGYQVCQQENKRQKVESREKDTGLVEDKNADYAQKETLSSKMHLEKFQDDQAKEAGNGVHQQENSRKTEKQGCLGNLKAVQGNEVDEEGQREEKLHIII